MKKKSLCYLANWKMYFSYNTEILFFKDHQKDFLDLAHKAELILFPSFLNIAYFSKESSQSTLKIGAQNISDHKQGAFTGQLSAQSLKECGAFATIVGHSECREVNKENDELIFEKIKESLGAGLLPVLCIGESLKEYEQNQSIIRITKQLTHLKILKNDPLFNTKKYELFIAYEPLFAIGSGVTASIDHIQLMLQEIEKIVLSFELDFITFRILYGGSVSSTCIKELKEISLLDGFLIGKSSINFAEFKKIIDS